MPSSLGVLEETTERTPPSPTSVLVAVGLSHTTSAVFPSNYCLLAYQSFPSAGRLLSHSYHVIPFPVSHQEFWPFPRCHSPGRQQASEILSFPLATGLLAVFGRGWRCCFPYNSTRASISISLLAAAGHRQAVTSQGQYDTLPSQAATGCIKVKCSTQCIGLFCCGLSSMLKAFDLSRKYLSNVHIQKTRTYPITFM